MACILLGMAQLCIIFVLALTLYQRNRYDGYVQLEEDPGGVKRANLIMEGDPETLLQTKKSIRFKIQRSTE